MQRSRTTKTVRNRLSQKRIKRSVSSNCAVSHRPWTRSLTHRLENFSFCSIPLRKTTKNLAFKLSKHLSGIFKQDNINIDNIMEEVNSKESILVLYGPESNIYSSTDEIPRDLRDIKLDSFPSEYYKLDIKESNISSDKYDVTLEQKPENYKLDSDHFTVTYDVKDELDDHQEFILIDPLKDISIATMINLYEIREGSGNIQITEINSNETCDVNSNEVKSESKIVREE